jgi:alkylation response protein AidB-like acyl-CoA dehydrogenase
MFVEPIESAEYASFRSEARAWLSKNAVRKVEGSTTSVSPEEHLRRARVWQRTLYDGGWAGLTWPIKYGGRGLSPHLGGIFNSEQTAFDVVTGPFTVGIAMVGPTLMKHGTDEQQKRFLVPILRGDELWCQLFSEPGAGSDLASLATRAVRDGDEWVLSGQKVWTSLGHVADYGILLARTDPDLPKHLGISYFVVDMHSPGITVRPLRQITGSAHFNEVFFDEVRIPVTNVLGEVNEGWKVAQTTLNSERGAIGGSSFGPSFTDVADLARQCDRTADVVVRQRLAEAFTRHELLRFLRLRVQAATSEGRMPGAEASVMKLAYSQHWARTSDLVESLLGANGTLLDYDNDTEGFWQRWFLGHWSVRLGGGTDEVQRNVMGERVLGLPREPDPTRDTPWSATPRN